MRRSARALETALGQVREGQLMCVREEKFKVAHERDLEERRPFQVKENPSVKVQTQGPEAGQEKNT